MRILIISDIHANWHALEAILEKESFEHLIFLGDAVDFGPNPKECTRFLMKSSTGCFYGVRGDHDHAMAYGINCQCIKELRDLASTTRHWGEDMLVSDEIGFLRRLPFHDSFDIEGLNFKILHEYDGLNYNFDFKSEDTEAFILSGHSHKPFLTRIGNKTFLNPGSVGQPRDFNPRASYAVIEDGEPSIKRVSYDIERTVKDLQCSNLPKYVKGKLISMLVIGGFVIH